MGGDRTALYRGGRDLRQIKTVPVEQAEQLLTFALPGDTLHKIPEEMTHTSGDVMRCIQSNLEVGYFVAV